MNDTPSRRQRLLAAALEEFAERGPAGARVESIARAAGVNKQLITYYFGGKDGLYREMLRWCFAQPPADPAGDVPGGEVAGGDLGDLLVGFFRRVTADPRWLRLLQWEALGDEPVDDDNRRAHYRGLLAFAEQGQAEGWFPADLDADLLFLSLAGAAEYPAAYPQITALVSGTANGTPDFVRRYEAHLRKLAARLHTDVSAPGGAGTARE
jgi:AcrR family transcriptional regulator